MNKTRLEAFSDGVFAIVITLLVLEVRPSGGGGGLDMFLHALPHMLTFALSFVLVGVYWVAHHNMLHFVREADRGLLWLNLFLLLAVAFIPFPAALLGAAHADPASVRVYCGSLALVNLTGGLLWRHALVRGLLLVSHDQGEFGRFVLRLHLAPILVYAIAAVVCAFSTVASLVLVALVPAFFILPNPLVERRVRAAVQALAEVRREGGV